MPSPGVYPEAAAVQIGTGSVRYWERVVRVTGVQILLDDRKHFGVETSKSGYQGLEIRDPVGRLTNRTPLDGGGETLSF